MKRLINRSLPTLATVIALTACVDGAVTTTVSVPADPVVSAPTSTTGKGVGGATTSIPLPVTSTDLEGLGFDEFVAESYELLLVRDPQYLTSLGIGDRFGMGNDQLNDMSPGFVEESQELERIVLDLLRTYDRNVLDGEDQITYDSYEWYLENLVAGHEFAYHQWPVHHFVNSYNYNLLIFLQEEHVIADIEDAEDYISRIGQVGRQVDQVIESLEMSVAGGIVPPMLVVDRTVQRLRDDLGGVSDADAVLVESLPLFVSARERLDAASIANPDKEDLLNRVAAALEESFVPGWIRLHDYMTSLRDIGRDDPGVGGLPNGQAFYAWLLRRHTSTDMSAEEVHQLGVESVSRITAEMRAVFDRLGYPADLPLPALVDRARRDAGFLTGEEAVVTTNRDLITEAEEVARPHFGLWPEAMVEVVPDRGGGGFYVPGSADGSRPGKFHVRTGDSVPLLITPTVNYHEAVPGHHTQVAVAQELGLPSFRRFTRYNAYTEGWALYAERLAGELGLYRDDPLGDVGRLQLELVRAVRLVVDTGVHAMGWSREQARAYMNEVVPTWSFEVERYMVLPGQATGYMIGMQEILRLREASRASLGDSFDLADFHDAVLGSGSLPLPVLDDVVAGWAGLDR